MVDNGAPYSAISLSELCHLAKYLAPDGVESLSYYLISFSIGLIGSTAWVIMQGLFAVC